MNKQKSNIFRFYIIKSYCAYKLRLTFDKVLALPKEIFKGIV